MTVIIKLFTKACLGVLVLVCAVAHAQSTPNGAATFPGSPVPVFIIDSNNYPGATHFVFLETKAAKVTPQYAAKVARFVRTIALQPGFRASMTLSDIDEKRMVVYYQFETAQQWAAARQNPAMFGPAGELQADSARFEDFAVNPLEQIAAGSSPTLPPGYYAQFRMGDGVGINEAIVVKGRQQYELTNLMRRAGIAANPNNSEGYKDFTFHQAVDGSRNMNLLHWSSVRTMSVAALGVLIQPLINNGLTGTVDGWGPGGVGYIGVHVYNITAIQNGRPWR
jgi:hypothetical protein